MSKQKGIEGLNSACASGDVERVREYLREDPSLISGKDSIERTPLAIAVITQKINVVKVLINEFNADTNQTFGSREFYPIISASGLNNTEIVRALIEGGANTDVECFGFTPMNQAGTQEIKDILLQQNKRPKTGAADKQDDYHFRNMVENRKSDKKHCSIL